MREIGAFEAKNTLGTLLDLVQRGEDVVLTRHGKPVARMVKAPAARDALAARAAAQRIRARRQELPRISADEWKAFRDEGRR